MGKPRALKIKSPIRFYQAFILLFFVLTIYAIYSSEIAPTELFKPDAWAQMSISVGASALTIVAIITSIVVSNENNKRVEMTDCLAVMSNRIEEKKRLNPDRSLDDIYDASKQRIDEAITMFSPIKYSLSTIGFLSFFNLLLSAVFAIEGFTFKLTLGSFFIGIILLCGYVVYVGEEFSIMDRLSSSRKKKGQLTLLANKVNGVPHQVALSGKKATISSNRQIERIEFKVRFSGNAKNGFLHATVSYANGLVSYIPDASTYLGAFGFANDFRLVLLEKESDTGILQMKGTIDLSFELVLRSRKQSEINPLIQETFIERLGKQEIYRHCSIGSDFRIKTIELRIYEDPFYKQNYKRREVDCITFEVTEPEPTI